VTTILDDDGCGDGACDDNACDDDNGLHGSQAHWSRLKMALRTNQPIIVC
jgi:hypothetical protein